jgi:CRP-like cAMP-binding protein
MQGTPSLRDVPFFRHLNDEELEELEELLEPASFEAGETIFEEDGP